MRSAKCGMQIPERWRKRGRVRREIILASIFMGLAVGAVAGQEKTDFDQSGLSQRGQDAYIKLRTAAFFSIGPVGYVGQPSGEEIALRELMHEGKATDALKSLCRTATTAGSLYALLGLSIRDVAAFKEELQ